MRKKVFFALGCVLYLTGCDSSSLEKVIPQTKFFPIQFSIQMEKEIVSFPTRSIPNNVIPEPVAIESSVEETTGLQAGPVLKQFKQEEDMENKDLLKGMENASVYREMFLTR